MSYSVVEKAGHKVANLQYNNEVIEYILSADFVNATQMAQSCGKRIGHWLENVQPADLAYEYAAIRGSTDIPTDLEWGNLSNRAKTKLAKENNYWGSIRIKTDGENEFRGTYIHRSIAIIFAQWCSAKFALWLSEQIRQLMMYDKLIVSKSDYTEFVQYKQNKGKVLALPSVPVDETDLQYRINNWVNLCVDNNRFNMEIPLLGSKEEVRRIDFIQSNPRNIIAYELKKNKVTASDISKTIAHKKYFHILQRHYNRPIKLVFLSPVGIDDAASTLLDTMPQITYQSVHELCFGYYMKAINKKYKHNMIELHNRLLSDRYRCLFDESFVQTIRREVKVGQGNKEIVRAVA